MGANRIGIVQPFTLATCVVEPDQEFASLDALARGVVAVRDKAYATVRPPIVARPAILARGAELPGGRVLALRMMDGSHNGRGALIGYAFMPVNDNGGEAAALLDAIARAHAAAGVKAVETV